MRFAVRSSRAPGVVATLDCWRFRIPFLTLALSLSISVACQFRVLRRVASSHSQSNWMLIGRWSESQSSSCDSLQCTRRSRSVWVVNARPIVESPL